MIDEILNNLRPRLEKAIEFLKRDLSTLHTGKANPSLVSDVLVEAYGSKMPLKSVASITAPNPKSIIITPWDKANLGLIEKAILSSNLGFTPINDGESVRINIPPLNEERRREFAKIVSTKAEEAKVSIRNLRHESHEEIKKAESGGKITEDEKYRGEDQLQKIVEEYNKKVDNITKNKEQELMQI
ncbi:MAG: ribosome recycling factor [Candidatus Aenigmarchaeota archaeon]|nr:ribosome recycling factor [Candidatus Aenigmarchaeota archaeon]